MRGAGPVRGSPPSTTGHPGLVTDTEGPSTRSRPVTFPVSVCAVCTTGVGRTVDVPARVPTSSVSRRAVSIRPSSGVSGGVDPQQVGDRPGAPSVTTSPRLTPTCTTPSRPSVLTVSSDPSPTPPGTTSCLSEGHYGRRTASSSEPTTPATSPPPSRRHYPSPLVDTRTPGRTTCPSCATSHSTPKVCRDPRRV